MLFDLDSILFRRLRLGSELGSGSWLWLASGSGLNQGFSVYRACVRCVYVREKEETKTDNLTESKIVS